MKTLKLTSEDIKRLSGKCYLCGTITVLTKQYIGHPICECCAQGFKSA